MNNMQSQLLAQAAQGQQQKNIHAHPSLIGEEVADAGRSVYIGQVDYTATPQELHEHFQHCGGVKRVTILCDTYTGHPKGFAYMEFEDEDAVRKACELDASEFKGRQLKVVPKRLNKPGKGKTGGGGKKGGEKGGGKGRKGGGGGGGFPYQQAGADWFNPYGGGGKGKGGKGGKQQHVSAAAAAVNFGQLGGLHGLAGLGGLGALSGLGGLGGLGAMGGMNPALGKAGLFGF
ncbi:Polyadenylate-binding protein 2 [Diplonema papillatum]|nr:Polyadenylate-binding protein 2 [Diplonema papillatum]